MRYCADKITFYLIKFFQVGYVMIIPGIENEVLGMEVDEEKQISIKPEGQTLAGHSRKGHGPLVRIYPEVLLAALQPR